MKPILVAAKRLQKILQGGISIFSSRAFNSRQVLRFASVLLLSCQLCMANDDSLWPVYLSKYAHPDFDIHLLPQGDHKRIASFTVAKERQAFALNPDHLYRVTNRSRWFARYIVDRCIERNLPIELALVPMVESAFDPFALSQGGAAGLWQFMPLTGREFGLQSDWWFDERRDVIKATDAALDYFEKLHRRFDNWLLAVAAYNAGPTRISRMIKKNQSLGGGGTFWELDLPKETARYVPRILAFKDMLLNQALSDVEFYPVPLERAFEAVQVESQLDLSEAARLAGADLQTVYLLNASLNRWSTPPNGPHRVLLPRGNVDAFKRQLASDAFKDRLRWQLYTVENGDTIGEIAAAHKSRVQFIKLANDIDGSNIKIGQQLVVPYVHSGHSVDHSEIARRIVRIKEMQQGIRQIFYRAKSGDSWWTIAKAHNVALADLLKWNHAKAEDVLRKGAKVTVWQTIKGARRNVSRTVYYTVKRGDNLSSIAARFDASVRQIVAANNLSAKKVLRPGQKLSIRANIAGH